MSEVKRLLCFVSSMDTGGAETFLMKIYRAVDKTKYQFDFLVNVEREGFYDKEILAFGGKIYYVVPKSQNPIQNILTTYKLIRKRQYQYVFRMTSHSLGAMDLLIAKMAGSKQLVLRSTNTQNISGFLGHTLHKLCYWIPKYVPTLKFAPSTEAAEYVFGKDCIKNGKVRILKNAIPVDQYKFNEQKRNIIKKELEIENKFVVGHIGRFNIQKNHKFLIDIFSEVKKINKRAVLLLVGTGELEQNIKKQIVNYGLSDDVIFAGVRNDAMNLLMAMDVLIFPSFFEGMPNVVIEAQATGLPCLVSDTITKEVKITELIQYKSIKYDDVPTWAQLAVDMTNNKNDRVKFGSDLQNAGYNIKTIADKFTKMVFCHQKK